MDIPFPRTTPLRALPEFPVTVGESGVSATPYGLASVRVVGDDAVARNVPLFCGFSMKPAIVKNCPASPLANVPLYTVTPPAALVALVTVYAVELAATPFGLFSVIVFDVFET
jgi:hypothetical protein